MPVLKKYSDSYDKEGYFIHAPIDGVSHPIPLQTPSVTARIYRELGYESGDNVPNGLTWKLYNAGLHWTENTGTEQQAVGEVKDAILEGNNPNLTDEQRKSILSIIDSYSGRFEDELHSLSEELDMSSSPSDSANTGSRRENTDREYFGQSFNYIDNKHYLDDLRTLEEYSCVYGRFYLEEYAEFRLCRIKFTSSEINQYVNSIAARNEFLRYLNQGYPEEEAVELMSNEKVKKRIQKSNLKGDINFFTAHIESLICGTKPDRYEIVPKSKLDS